MNKILIIGSVSHEQVDNIEWTQPFHDLEKYDCLIIDLGSFPKDYPRTLFTNIGILKRVTRLFMRDNKEIFCVMEKPFKILFKQIPLNYSWMPFPQKLTVNPMLLGKVIQSTNRRFAQYIKNVEKWDNELFWESTDNINFEAIAVNKAKNPVAATITMINRGKIHFLPRATKISNYEAIKLLTDLATREINQEYPWLNTINDYPNLFSADDRKIARLVHLILEELGIATIRTNKFNLTNQKDGKPVFVIATKGKIELQNTKIKELIQRIENQKNKRKIIVVANTYKDLAIGNRVDKQDLDIGMKLFFETNNVLFLTTLSLYNLYKKVANGQISAFEVSRLLQNQIGEIRV